MNTTKSRHDQLLDAVKKVGVPEAVRRIKGVAHETTDRAQRRAAIPVTKGMMEAGAAVIGGAKIGDFIGTDLQGVPFMQAWAAFVYREMELARRGE